MMTDEGCRPVPHRTGSVAAATLVTALVWTAVPVPAAAQQNDQRAPVVAPPPAVTPSPVGFSGQVTSWLQVRGELRGRLEEFSGGGFNDSHDAYWLDRFRVNATVTPTRSVRFVIQAQDARVFDKEAGGQAVPFRDTLDLRMAYGELGGAQTSIRVGRQELVFGEQRLLGHVSWLNTARTFDAVRATVGRKQFRLDAFAASVVTIRPSAFDKSGSGNALYGVYGSTGALVPKAVVEPYFLWRQSRGLTLERGGTGELHQATVGVRSTGKLPLRFDYGTEMAVQTGSVASDQVQAWAGHWVVGNTLGTPRRPRIFGEYNYASGDDDPRDGTRGTFDQLYPTAHDKYGLADQVGWRNIRHLRGGVELKPAKAWQVGGSYHSFWLASARDALYSASGAAVARSAAGLAGRHVGQEVDAQATYTYSAQLQIAGGYAYLLPGEFLENTTASHAYGFSYLTFTYVFIGDKPAAGPGGQPR